VARERGQAGIETLIALPVLLLVVLAGAQAAMWAASSVLASLSASAGARALVRGETVDAAARAELPGPFARDARVSDVDGTVRVVIRVPSLVPGVPALRVTGRAEP
jgi:Flp pilus assembly protein TadG